MKRSRSGGQLNFRAFFTFSFLFLSFFFFQAAEQRLSSTGRHQHEEEKFPFWDRCRCWI